MPSTANQEVQALRVVFGVPKDSGSIDKMERWLREHCRDYRRHDDGDKVVVTMVLHRPMKGQALRDLLAHHVRNWGFVRPSHARGQLEFTSIDAYMEGGVGALLKGKVRDLLDASLTKFEKKKQDREKALQDKLAAFRKKQLQRHSLVLKRCLKSLWDVASNRLRKDLLDKNKGFRDDPVVRRRRMGRGVDYERLDEYKEDGEPDWEAQDKKRRLQVTVQM